MSKKRRRKAYFLGSCLRPLSVICEHLEKRTFFSTYVVNTTSDLTTLIPGQLTLRQAVADANVNGGNGIIDFDQSVFAPGTSKSIVLVQGQIELNDVTGSITVNGPGENVLTISAGGASRVMQVDVGTTLAISGLSIVNGAVKTATGVTSAGATATGAGILNSGTLSLSDLAVNNNSADGANANDSSGSANVGAGAAAGGGIFSTGMLTLTDVMIQGNTAGGGAGDARDVGGSGEGGGIFSAGGLVMSDCTIVGNTASGGDTHDNPGGGYAEGGGIWTSGVLSITGSTIETDSALGGSGEGFAEGDGGSAWGGGVYATATSTITGSIVSKNLAQGGYAGLGDGIGGSSWGGGIYVVRSLNVTSTTISSNSSIAGNGPTQDNGVGGDAYGGAVASIGVLTITGSTLTTNKADGGAESDAISNGFARSLGGAVYSSQSLVLTTSTITGNISEGGYGGGYGDPEGGGYGEGGGVFTAGMATVTACGVTSNEAVGGVGGTSVYSDPGGSGGNGEGAGFYNSGSLTITNSTFSLNSSTGGDGGHNGDEGGSYAGTGGNGVGAAIYTTESLTLNDTTISGNTASGGSGGLADSGYLPGAAGIGQAAGVAIETGNAIFSNTIISDNTSNGTTEYDISGTASNSSGFDLIGIGGGLTNGVNGNQIGVVNPKLAPLATNGGPTLTMLPLAGSPVINAGSNILIPTGTLTDQRGTGYPRIVNNVVDIGAVEYPTAQSTSPPPEIILTPPVSQIATAGQNTSFTLGSFTASDTVGPYGVFVSWGDGTTSNFQVANVGFIPSQLHTYTSVEAETVILTVGDAAGQSSGTKSFLVTISADTSSSPEIVVMPAASQAATAGRSEAIALGIFTASNAIGPYTLSVNWGDGTTSSFQLPNAGDIPSETHTYVASDSDTVTLSVSDVSGASSAAENFIVTVGKDSSVPVPAETTTGITVSTVIENVGTSVMLTASVSGAASESPTGTVTFSEDGITLNTIDLINGTAVCTTSSLPLGNAQIVATYNGDNGDLASASSAITVLVQEPSQIFPSLIKPTTAPVNIAGKPLNAKLSVLLANTGIAIKGSFTFMYYASTSASLTGNQTLLMSLKKQISLKAERKAFFSTVIRSLPADLPSGSYYLVTDVIDPSGLMAVTATPASVTVTAPFIDLAVKVSAVTPSVVSTRKNGIITLVILNSGNVSAVGLLVVNVTPSSDGSTPLPIVLSSYKLRTDISALRNKKVSLRLKIPASLNSGNYFSYCTISFDGHNIVAIGSSPFQVASVT